MNVETIHVSKIAFSRSSLLLLLISLKSKTNVKSIECQRGRLSALNPIEINTVMLIKF